MTFGCFGLNRVDFRSQEGILLRPGELEILECLLISGFVVSWSWLESRNSIKIVIKVK